MTDDRVEFVGQMDPRGYWEEWCVCVSIKWEQQSGSLMHMGAGGRWTLPQSRPPYSMHVDPSDICIGPSLTNKWVII